ncbi:MAG: Uma2 family endonuclease [Clostridiales bacterium]|jgi:Uma2 family endonuclease|nr:Uma2 family endonuclease [Clostridiales bacterium]
MSEIKYVENRTYEKIDGKIYLMARPSLNHVTISANIWKIFSRFLAGKVCKAYIEPDVFLDDDNNFVPDVIIVCDKSKRKGKGIYGAPDLVAEVLSPSTAKIDLADKKAAYEKHGVKEYWIIDPVSKAISVYHLEAGLLNLNNVYFHKTEEEKESLPDDDLKSLAPEFNVSFFDDLAVKLEEIFEELE